MQFNSIVIDNGSDITKAGFSGFLIPGLVVPTIIGYPKYDKYIKTDIKDYKYHIGHVAQNKKSILNIHNPIKNGIIDNWEHMTKIWEYIFDRLGTESNNKKVLLIEPILNSIKNKEHIFETMFEYFNVSSSFMGINGILSLYGNGKISGITLDIGHEVSHIVPVYEGYSIKHAVNRINLAGNDITEHLKRLLELKGTRFTTTTETDIIKKIKEKYSYCYTNENRKDIEYILPDKKKIVLGNELYECNEILFNPLLIGKDIDGIDTILYKSIMHTDIDIRRTMFSNIILSGGTTMMNNFNNRLYDELKKKTALNIDIIIPENRIYSAWIGGSLLCSLSTFDSSWISKTEYEECGKSIIYRKSM